MRRVEIIVRDLSPPWIKIIGILIFLATAFKIVTMTFFDVNPFVYLISLGIAIAIWTGKEVVLIDYDNGKIAEGFRILGLTRLDWVKFSGIEKIYINSVQSSETFYHLTRTLNIRHQAYKAFLKTSEGNKICIGIHANKGRLMQKIHLHNETIGAEIFDNT